MKTLKITRNRSLTRQIYQRYFDFKQEEAFQKLHIPLILGLCTIPCLAGLIFKIDIVFYIGLCSILSAILWFSYQFIKYKNACRNYLKQLEKTTTSQEFYMFKFDADQIVYEFENATQQFKWAAIKTYEENGGDLYLYGENGELFDILSDSIMGEMLSEFKEILLKSATTNGVGS